MKNDTKNSRKGITAILFAAIAMVSVLVIVPTAIAAPDDDYVIYSTFAPPGGGYVWGAGGYIADYGVPGTWGDELQYVYFIQRTGSARTAYKVKVWVTNEGSVDDPTPYIDIRQHPGHPDPAHVGPIEPRHFEIVSSVDVSAFSNWDSDEFHVDSTGIYLGAYPSGINKWDHDWNYIGQIAPCAPVYTASLAYNPAAKTWYAGNHMPRDIYQLSDTDGDGDFMDETWQYIFSYPSYGGGHHDGMEYVGGYLWISDMTSDVIGKWQYDSDTDTWTEIGRYFYTEAAVLEGMGFGANDHFWAGGYYSGYVYELGDEITMYYPIADAGEDVPAYPPTIPVTFDGSGSHHTDPEREIVLYEWDFDGDGVYDYSGMDPVAEYAYPAYYNLDGSINWTATAQTYTAVLRVTDDDPVTPKTDVDTCQVHITAPPWKPVADPNGPYNTRVDQEVCLDGSASFHPAAEMYDPGHPWYDEIVAWEWDLDNDGEFDDATGEIVCTQWSVEGTYFIGLRVTDGAGAHDEKYTVVIVSAIHDVAVESVTPSKSVVNCGEVVTIDVVVSNLGDFTESFDTTVYYDSNVIGVASVADLDPGDTEGLQFSWDTTGVPEGSHTIKAVADTVPGEIITGNNVFENGEIEMFVNRPPDVTDAHPSIDCLWPPNHKFVDITIEGITDPDGDEVTITITNITSDEPTATIEGAGGDKHAPDADPECIGTSIARVRAERSGNEDGRVYEITFVASDGIAETVGSVLVKVPHDQSGDCVSIDSGQNYDATERN